MNPTHAPSPRPRSPAHRHRRHALLALLLALCAALGTPPTASASEVPAEAPVAPIPDRTPLPAMRSLGFGIELGAESIFNIRGRGRLKLSIEGRVPVGNSDRATVDITANVLGFVVDALVGSGLSLDTSAMWHRRYGKDRMMAFAFAAGGQLALVLGGATGPSAIGTYATARIGGDFASQRHNYETGLYLRPSLGPLIGLGRPVLVGTLMAEVTFQWRLGRRQDD